MKKHVKRIIIAVSIMLAVLVTVVAGYLIYIAASYSRVADNITLIVKGNSELAMSTGEDYEYEILTYNIGFGAYTPDYSFFMDSGVMKDGKKVRGKYGKGISKDAVRANSHNIASLINNINYDFIFAQEVDEDGTRSYHINQREMLSSAMPGYAGVYATNFHSPYLWYPINDPHGANKSGLLTLSKYRVESAVRRSLPVPTGIDKYFELDRCFSVSRVSAGEHELVLVNLHLSAYDDGKIRTQQFDMLTEFLVAEYEKGNYVIAGGDFNFDICDSANTFKSKQQRPGWAADLPSKLPQGFSVAEADNSKPQKYVDEDGEVKEREAVPTCRSSDLPYTKGENFTAIIDGFIVSDNVKVVKVENQNTGFAYSDHNPVHMKFKLI